MGVCGAWCRWCAADEASEATRQKQSAALPWNVRCVPTREGKGGEKGFRGQQIHHRIGMLFEQF